MLKLKRINDPCFSTDANDPTSGFGSFSTTLPLKPLLNNPSEKVSAPSVSISLPSPKLTGVKSSSSSPLRANYNIIPTTHYILSLFVLLHHQLGFYEGN